MEILCNIFNEIIFFTWFLFVGESFARSMKAFPLSNTVCSFYIIIVDINDMNLAIEASSLQTCMMVLLYKR